MNNMKKMIYAVILVLLLFISISIFSFVKLYFSSEKIAKLYFTPYYLAKIKQGESDINVFIEYMENSGWEYVGREGGMMSFKRDKLVVEVTNRQIKTVIIQK